MRKTSLSTLKRELSSYQYFAALETFLERVTSGEKPLAVILFGSLAKAEHLPDSDIDLGVIYEHDVDFMRKLLDLKKLDPTGVIEAFPFGIRQLHRKLSDLNPLVLDMLYDGILLFTSSEEMLRNVQQQLEEMIRLYGLQKTRRGWKIGNLPRWQVELARVR